MSLPTTGRAVGGTPPDCSWATPILHADLDAFYASVEALRDPSLRGRPVIVGGTSSRGVVTSASYEARRAEVASGMPTSRARRLCPEGIFLAPDFELYRRYSNLVREVFDSFSPVVEPLSLDEAFLDVSGARRMWPDPSTLAEALRARVAGEVGLAVSVGVAPNKFLAKVASKRAKPDGLVVVAPEVLDRFLYPLGVEELWGVGEITAACLRRLGLRTIGDVGKVPAATLERALGSLGREVARLAAGKDDRPVTPEAPRKSMGAEETFEQDLVEEAQVLRGILRLSDRLSSRLRAHGASGQTVTLKVRFSNYATVTRSKTLPH
ncbi:MAG: DNA polymerase IV, partial [Actinomycetota bacterium]